VECLLPQLLLPPPLLGRLVAVEPPATAAVGAVGRAVAVVVLLLVEGVEQPGIRAGAALCVVSGWLR
jgi:hypothetical protein